VYRGIKSVHNLGRRHTRLFLCNLLRNKVARSVNKNFSHNPVYRQMDKQTTTGRQTVAIT